MKWIRFRHPTFDSESVCEPIDRLMRVTAHLGLRWMPNESCSFESRGTVAAKADELSTRDKNDTQRIPPGGTPSYAVASVYSQFRVSEFCSLYVAIENLF